MTYHQCLQKAWGAIKLISFNDNYDRKQQCNYLVLIYSNPEVVAAEEFGVSVLLFIFAKKDITFVFSNIPEKNYALVKIAQREALLAWLAES